MIVERVPAGSRPALLVPPAWLTHWFAARPRRPLCRLTSRLFFGWVDPLIRTAYKRGQDVRARARISPIPLASSPVCAHTPARAGNLPPAEYN